MFPQPFAAITGTLTHPDTHPQNIFTCSFSSSSERLRQAPLRWRREIDSGGSLEC